MLFNSISFLIFFPVVSLLYFALPHKYRWFLLLAASSYFYMAFIPVYVLVLLVTILIDYFAGIYIERSDGKRKKTYLILSIISTALVLFIFKYFNFFNNNIEALAHFFNWNYSIESLKLILPVGLSFHTFQSLSYVIEVYRGNQKAEHNLGIYALYVMFFPQLVAGPIERPQNLLHQFYEEHNFDYNRVVDGLRFMLWGFFLKIVIADRLVQAVNMIYNNPTNYSGWPLIIATYYFAFQIFCDFAGYSLIAIGSAKVLGFNLMTNFRRPYFSQSISEFWKRWHISLSTWFKDYLYIPLGGNRVTRGRWYFNLFIVFLVSGLWHGANVTFLIWGALHGFYLVFSLVTEKIRKKGVELLRLNHVPKLYSLFKIAVTFNLVTFAWIFFRANTLSDAIYIVSNLFRGARISNFVSMLPKDLNYTILAVGLILLMESVHVFQEHGGVRQFFNTKPLIFRWTVYMSLLLIILLFGVFEEQKFIYFQF